MLNELLQAHRTTLTVEELLSITESKVSCISLKDRQGYCYANLNFAHLMGTQSLKNVLNRKDSDLTDNRDFLKTIQLHDDWILEEAKPLKVCETIYPKNKPHLIKTVQGYIHPVFSQDEAQPRFVLGIFTPSSKLLSLDKQYLFELSFDEMRKLLVKRSYFIHWQGMQFQLSRREIEIIICMVRGWHAGEVAGKLGLKQTTIESYLQNIKSKLGINQKGELISAVIESDLLSHVLV